MNKCLHGNDANTCPFTHTGLFDKDGGTMPLSNQETDRALAQVNFPIENQDLSGAAHHEETEEERMKRVIGMQQDPRHEYSSGGFLGKMKKGAIQELWNKESKCKQHEFEGKFMTYGKLFFRKLRTYLQR